MKWWVLLLVAEYYNVYEECDEDSGGEIDKEQILYHILGLLGMSLISLEGR